MSSVLLSIFAAGSVLGMIILFCPIVDCLFFPLDCIEYYHDSEACSECQAAENVTPPTPPPDATPSPTPDPKTEAQWGTINQDNAEKNCLKAAQDAVGFPESLGIFNCKCRAEDTDSQKTYRCNIGAIDNKPHPVLLVCIKATRLCTITSEQGTDVLTFDELEARTGERAG